MIKIRAEIKEHSNRIIMKIKKAKNCFFEKSTIKQTKISAEIDQDKKGWCAHKHKYVNSENGIQHR